MASSKNIAIIILAAGASSRMGQTKQLLPWEDTTLLGNAIYTANASDASSVVVVLGANAASIRNMVQNNFEERQDGNSYGREDKMEIREGRIEIIENQIWATGLGSSIARGTDFLLKKKNKPNGILIMLADQPLIDTGDLNTMMTAFNSGQETIVATAYENRAGVPALFSENYYWKLAKLDDDFGAKQILEHHEKNVMVLNLGRRTVDIDTKTDYENLMKTSHE